MTVNFVIFEWTSIFPLKSIATDPGEGRGRPRGSEVIDIDNDQLTTWENHSIAAASCLDRTPRKVITQRNSCACSYWGNIYKEFNALEKKIVKHEHLCKQPAAFCGICKRPFQKKDWRPQNTLSSPVEFVSHKTTLKEVFRYLDVQVCRCVLQIPLCTMTPPHHFFASLMVEGIFAEIHCK